MTISEQVSSICTECGGPVTFGRGSTHVQCGFCSAGLAVGDATRLVRLDCPICAGNFYYIDGRMAGKCPYCSAPLLALTRDRVLRYVIRPSAERPADVAAEAELCLLPFWFLSALHYGFDIGSKITIEADMGPSPSEGQDPADAMPTVTRRDSGPQKLFRGRVVERWVADPTALALGIDSLRMRASVHPLEPFEAEHEQLGRLLPTTLPVAEAKERLFAAAMTIGYASDGLTKLDCQRAELVSDEMSLLYYPFWIARGADGAVSAAWDAVSGQPEPLSSGGRPATDTTTSAFDELKVVELRCGSCREPLTMASHGVVFPCHRCDTFWVAERDGLAPFAAAYAKPQVAQENHPVLWLPFWRVKAELSYCERPATQAKDVRLVLGVTVVAQAPTAAPDAPLCYFIPAYGALRAPRLDYAARDLTRLQPLLERGSYQSGEAFACFFGPDDAERLAYVTWLQLLPGGVPRRLASLRIKTGEVSLWYVPFADRGRELTNLLTGMRYDRTAFRGVGH